SLRVYCSHARYVLLARGSSLPGEIAIGAQCDDWIHGCDASGGDETRGECDEKNAHDRSHQRPSVSATDAEQQAAEEAVQSEHADQPEHDTHGSQSQAPFEDSSHDSLVGCSKRLANA